MILVATIEHSGSRTALSLLGWPKRAVLPLEEAHKARPAHGILFANLYDSLIDEIMECARVMPVITTRRPLKDIQASWVKEGWDMDGLERQLANYERLLTAKPYILELGSVRPST